jgi:hypothetical protein
MMASPGVSGARQSPETIVFRLTTAVRMFGPVATRPRNEELSLDISSANWSSLEPFAYGGGPMIVEERIYTSILAESRNIPGKLLIPMSFSPPPQR